MDIISTIGCTNWRSCRHAAWCDTSTSHTPLKLLDSCHVPGTRRTSYILQNVHTIPRTVWYLAQFLTKLVSFRFVFFLRPLFLWKLIAPLSIVQCGSILYFPAVRFSRQKKRINTYCTVADRQTRGVPPVGLDIYGILPLLEGSV